jgi:dienelactone hydrolase
MRVYQILLVTALASTLIAHSYGFGAIGTVRRNAQKGRVAKLGGLDVYISQEKAKPSSAVILFTDIYGWKFNNTRVWSDRLAQDTGALVVIPDFFRGTTLPADRSMLMTW